LYALSSNVAQYFLNYDIARPCML